MFWGLNERNGKPPMRAGILVPGMSVRPSNRYNDWGCGDNLSYRDAIDFASRLGIGVVRDLPHVDSGPFEQSYFMGLLAGALSPIRTAVHPDHVPCLEPRDLPDPTLLAGLSVGQVNYQVVLTLKRVALWSAYQRFCNDCIDSGHQLANEFHAFCASKRWIEPYGLLRTLVELRGDANWKVWGADVATYDAAKHWLDRHTDARFIRKTCQFWQFVQWVLYRQGKALKEYAGQRNVLLVGMLSFGTVADRWAYPHLYLEGWWGGAPPEPAFFADRKTAKLGQIWGVDVPDWEAHQREDFRWHRERIADQCEVSDGAVVDHALGWARGPYAFPFPGHEADPFVELSRDEIATEMERRGRGRVHPQYFPNAHDEGDDAVRNRLNAKVRLSMGSTAAQAAGAKVWIWEGLGMQPSWFPELMTELGFPDIVITKFHRQHSFGPYAPLSTLPYEAEVGPGTHDIPPQAAQYRDLLAAANAGNADARQELGRWFDFIGLPGHAAPETYDDRLRVAMQRTHLFAPCGLSTLPVGEIFGWDFMTHVVGQADPWAWLRRLPGPLTQYADHPAALQFSQMVRESGRWSHED